MVAMAVAILDHNLSCRAWVVLATVVLTRCHENSNACHRAMWRKAFVPSDQTYSRKSRGAVFAEIAAVVVGYSLGPFTP